MNRRTMNANVIKAGHYAATVNQLKADPIIKQMAEVIPAEALGQLTNEAGEPIWNFMQAANQEYANRGGEIEAHIGGVAEAIIALRQAS